MNVWNSLRLMEHTPALKYQWQRSHCNDLLLCAIDIDARNIVRQILYFYFDAFFPVECGSASSLWFFVHLLQKTVFGISGTEFLHTYI